MAGKATRLQRAAEGEAVVQDQLILRFEAELAAVLRRADRLIAALVRQLAAEDSRFIRTQQSLGRAVRMRQDLAGALTQAGLRLLLNVAVEDRLDALADRVLANNGIAAAAADLTPLDVESILALKELRLADLLDWSGALSVDAWRLTVDGVLGLRPVDDLVTDLSDLLDTNIPRARTLYDTSVSTFSRQVGLLHTTGEAAELFYYAGPVDSVTRQFCLAHVGKVFRRDEVDDMDNGQLGDPLVTGGGYNCRHAFKAVSSLDEELQQLHETGGRLPHVEEQLQALEAEKRAA